MSERDQLEREHDAAATTVSNGFIALAFVPIVGVIAGVVAMMASSVTVTMGAMLVAAAYAMAGGVGGFIMIGSGGANRRRLHKQLRELDEAHQLPEARIVKR